MKTKRTSAILHPAGKMKTPIADRTRSRVRTVISLVCFGVLFSVVIASAFYTASSASSRIKLQRNSAAPPPALAGSQNKTVLSSTSLKSRWSSPLLVPVLADDTIATYEVVAGACTNNLKDTFSVGQDVCVKIANAPLGDLGPVSLISIGGTDGTVEDLVDVTTDPQEIVFTLPATTTSVVNGDVVDNRGLWRAAIHSSADFGLRAAAYFSVTDPAAAAADLVVFSDSTALEPVTPGDPTGFSVYVRNEGPDPAVGVHVTQNVPSNMSFDSATADSGTAFSCSVNSGVVDCAPTGNLAAGATSAFTINYTVSAGAPSAIITSEVDIASTTTFDPRTASNSSISKVEIRAAGSSGPTCSISCPLNRTVSANTTNQSNQPGAIVNFAGDLESSGDCGTITSSPASGSFFGLGTTTVNVSSGTGSGTCSFTITVTQTAAPTISCAADQTATTSGNSNEASVTVNPPTYSGTNAQLTGVRNDNRSLSDGYPVGTTTITWTAAECDNPPACDDPNARSASCTQHIIVTSPDAPTISCPSNKTFTASGCDGKTLTAGDIGSPSATGSNVQVTGERSDHLNLLTDPYPVGQTLITWSATDDADRVASCVQTITISSSGSDSTPPTLSVPPDVSATTSSCTATLDDELGVATASDNCGSASITRTGVPSFACPTPSEPNKQCESFVFPTGTTIITYTATDGAGNTVSGTQRVVVTESPAVNPTINAPVDVAVSTGVGATSCGTVVSDAALGTAVANDNCAGVTVSRSGVPAGNDFPVGTTTVTYTATDASGNTASDTQVVTVTDDTAPVVTPPGPVTLYTGANATSCGVTVSDLNTTLGTGSVTDNCAGVGAVSRSGVPAGNDFPVGDTVITYSATDAHGNTGTATQTVTVIDNTLPVVTPPGPVTLYTGPGATSCGVTVSNLDATLGTGSATDNCPGVGAVSRSGVPAGNSFPVGMTTLTYSATDAHGNVGTATQIVTVIDNTVPVITTNGQTVSLWPPNHSYHEFSVTDFVTSVFDNCGGIGISNVVIDNVTSDEGENGAGDGNTVNDIVIASDCRSLQLRSERNGGGDGRVYTITFRVTDTHGNTGTATAQVVVPHNTGQTAVNSGAHYTVTGNNCP